MKTTLLLTSIALVATLIASSANADCIIEVAEFLNSAILSPSRYHNRADDCSLCTTVSGRDEQMFGAD
jgi:hypothetical protein